MRKPIILGKKKVSRVETLQDYADRHDCWYNYIIGVSCYFGFWAWLRGRLTGRHIVYYCIDFYCLEGAKNLYDYLFIRASWLMDWFLINCCDEIWDISTRINVGRVGYGQYYARGSTIVSCCYPPSYFRYERSLPAKLVFVGLYPYGKELWENLDFFWIDGDWTEEEMLEDIPRCGIGLALWKDKHNAYYGDSGKTKLYFACGIPVITVKWTTLAPVIEKYQAGITINYDKQELGEAIKKIQGNYVFYKENVKKMREYCDSDFVLKVVEK